MTAVVCIQNQLCRVPLLFLPIRDMDITYGTSWHEFLHPHNRAGLPSTQNAEKFCISTRRTVTTRCGCTCPSLSCGSDLWNVAAEERSPLFSCSVPSDAANSVSANSVRWVNALAARSAGYASHGNECDGSEVNTVNVRSPRIAKVIVCSRRHSSWGCRNV